MDRITGGEVQIYSIGQQMAAVLDAGRYEMARIPGALIEPSSRGLGARDRCRTTGLLLRLNSSVYQSNHRLNVWLQNLTPICWNVEDEIIPDRAKAVGIVDVFKDYSLSRRASRRLQKYVV